LQGNQFYGEIEVDIDKHPTGVFVREGGEKGEVLLSFSIAKRKKERKMLFAKGVSRLRTRPGRRPGPATFEKAAKSFHTGLVCTYCCFVLAPKVFCFFFAMFL
jgi:hypothetical protein